MAVYQPSASGGIIVPNRDVFSILLCYLYRAGSLHFISLETGDCWVTNKRLKRNTKKQVQLNKKTRTDTTAMT